MNDEWQLDFTDGGEVSGARHAHDDGSEGAAEVRLGEDGATQYAECECGARVTIVRDGPDIATVR